MSAFRVPRGGSQLPHYTEGNWVVLDGKDVNNHQKGHFLSFMESFGANRMLLAREDGITLFSWIPPGFLIQV